ncbi:helix-turn-helix transcriptional regulator [Ekhidna sp. MALMAid0563]|uniref:helix-turn-helix domain-containing protein n=1 Tax=Ekhidna sp. MALMAid0563 TaxID=3143937 RepID=UPI0032DF4B36
MLQEEGTNQPVHRHDFYFLLIVEKGTGLHTIDFDSYSVQNYTVFFMRPGQIHELNLNRGSKGFILEFSREYIPSDSGNSRTILKSISKQVVFTFDSQSIQPIRQSAEKIYSETLNHGFASNEVIQLHIHLIFIELHRRIANPPAIDKSSEYSQHQLDTFMELLEEYFRRKKQVSDYAEMMNITTYQLNNITKSVLKKSVSSLIKDQILLEAKRLLLTTTNQINHIAYELGYDDESYFTRFFKKHLGFSPSQFRQNSK